MARQKRREKRSEGDERGEERALGVSTRAKDGDLHDLVGALARIVVRLAKEASAGLAEVEERT